MEEPQVVSPQQPTNPPAEEPPVTPPSDQPQKAGRVYSTKLKFILSFVVIALAGTLVYLLAFHHSAKNSTTTTTQTTPKTSVNASATTAQGLQLDSSKNYGNKYANGILPVGDGKYVTDAAKNGYVYTCGQYAQNLKADSGGAGKAGPWFTNNNTEYDINKKTHVRGAVTWQSSFSNTVSGSTRTIISNDLPNHITGIFPIAATDPAYAYDKNPNSIMTQSFTYTLAASPTYGSPQCVGGQVGVMLTGVALFSGFDAGGRDAGAWEVQDDCSGHPEKTGEYHYHTLSSCIKDTSVSTVIGFALDGFPITGPKIGDGNFLTTTDLDECHGLTSQVTLDGKKVTTYHYVMTEDFPYSVSCYRATAITPPGQQSAAVRQSQSQTAPPPR